MAGRPETATITTDAPHLIGYARASSLDQSTAIQVAALKAAGCRTVREEKRSGTKATNRPELQAILDFVREGDTLVVTRLDRLARSVADLQMIALTLRERGASLRVLEQPVDTTSATGKLFFDVLSAFAEFETALRRERQMEGIAAAKKRGVYTGGKPRIDRTKVLDALKSMTPTAAAKALKVSRATIYRIAAGR